MKRLFFALLSLLLLVPVALWAKQATPATRVEITGVNSANLPTIVVNAAVYDRLGQPIFGLTADNFTIAGPLAERARIVSVENISDDQLAFSVVLAIDTSSSMDGLPLDRAKEAAINFVNSIGPNDPVAILTFDSNVEVVQDYTTDKAALLSTIEALRAGGKTALYKGMLEAVTKAASSPSPRRAVIVLSDGAEYGNISGVERGAALQEAIIRGVPVYTIGVGYGFDRTYLQETSGGTNARFAESPTLDELVAIYGGLAATLRSQYIVTLNADVPGDGTEYGLTLAVTTPDGTASADTVVRVPILVPIVTLPDLPTEPITEPVTVTAEVRADDPITTAQFRLDGVVAGSFTEPPYSITLDPLRLRPGEHKLTFTATDASGGGIGQVNGTFTVAALPSSVTIVGLGTQPIAEPVTITLDVSGQTPATSAAFTIDGGEAVVTEAPYLFTIDPATLTPGEHTLTVDVTNVGGAVATVTQAFTAAALPPQITLSGLEAQQEISEPTEVTIEATGQTPVSSVVVTVNNVEITTAAQVPAVVTVNPAELQPGRNLLVATVTLESGQSEAASVEFIAAALPPEVTITGLQTGETLTENRTITVEAGGQTAITAVTFALDGQEVATETRAPYTFELDVLAIPPGGHILTATATNAGGQSASADVTFMISDAPSLTATASAQPSATPVPTETATWTETPAPTGTPTATLDTTALAAQEALLSEQATGTANAIGVIQQATSDAQGTLVAGTPPTEESQASVNQAATTAAQAATNAHATTEARATDDARDAANAMATANALATQGVDLTASAEALQSQNVQATANAQGTLDARSAQSTLNALNAQATQAARATSDALNVAATHDAQATTNALNLALATANAQATQNADATAQAQAALDIMQATRNAEATANARATSDALATLNAAATRSAQATLDTQATRDAQATLDAAASATTSAQAALDTQATRDAQATQDAQATLDAAATATANSQATRDTEATDATATANAQGTLDADATLMAQETAEPTEEPSQAAPTTEATAVAQVVASPTATGDRTDRTPSPTITPIGTLTIETVPGTTAASTDILPIVLVIIAIIVVLIILFLFLRGRRTRNG